MGRPKINKKKESVTIYLKPDLLEKYKKYCKDNEIENYSEHIEKLINNQIKKKDV